MREPATPSKPARRLSPTERLGLDVNWYAADHHVPEIRMALTRGFLKRWCPRIAEILEENRRTNSHRPRNYLQLARHLRLNPTRFSTDKAKMKVAAGDRAYGGGGKSPPIPTTLKLISHAVALGVSEWDLCPDAFESIAYGAYYLAKTYNKSLIIDEIKYLSYGLYVAMHPPRYTDTLDDWSVQEVHRRLGVVASKEIDDIGDAIREVSGLVGDVIQKHYHLLIDTSPSEGD